MKQETIKLEKKDTIVSFKKIKTFKKACESLKIETHGDAFKMLKLDRKLLSEVSIDECDDVHLQLMIIVKSVNPNWEVDSKSTKQRKYFAFFKCKTDKSGFDFSATDFGHWFTISLNGSRLCSETPEKAEYIGRTFEKEFNELLK